VSLSTSALRRVLPAVGVVAALGATACGSSSSGSSSGSASGSAASTSPAANSTSTRPATSSKVSLSAAADGSLAFNTTSLSAKAGTVALVMANPSGSGIEHAIAVSGNGVDASGQVVGAGGTSTVSEKLKPGTYTFFCPVPGHEAAGMNGTLTVR
jgi:plastocyanin